MAPWTRFALTTAAMVAFAINSVLGRLALQDGAVDPASFTAIRLGSGAVVLWLLATLSSTRSSPDSMVQGQGPGANGASSRRPRGNAWSALALFVYAAAFSFAYVTLETGTGALILFACVQVTMIGHNLATGHSMKAAEWVGLLVALLGFGYLVSPGLTAPDPFGAVLMGTSGIAWGVYSIRGKKVTDALSATAGNFVLSLLGVVVLAAIFGATASVTPTGVGLAIACGALTSGVGYALWYGVLPHLAPTTSSVVQLTVPVIAALGGIAFVSEQLSLRVGLSSFLILGGVAAVIVGGKRTAASSK